MNYSVIRYKIYIYIIYIKNKEKKGKKEIK